MSRRARILILLVLAAAGAGYRLLSEARPEAPTAPERPAIHAWDVLGCWEVRLTSWAATPPSARPDHRGDSARATRPGASRAAGTGPVRHPSRLPEGLEPPRSVMLLPDSTDLWGRVLDSHRAVEVKDGGATPAPVGKAARHARALRWFTAGDTLWIVWSQGGTRAGVALTRRGETMRGAARAMDDSADVSAGAEAWPVNCATGEPERPPPWRRR